MNLPPTPPSGPFSRTPSPEPSRDGSREESPASPGNNPCAICLSKIEDKAETGVCSHEFCYTCISAWAKVKTQCPLCKTKFKSIRHSFDADGKYAVTRVERVSGTEDQRLNRRNDDQNVRTRDLMSNQRSRVYTRDLWALQFPFPDRHLRPHLLAADPSEFRRIRAWINRELVAVRRATGQEQVSRADLDSVKALLTVHDLLSERMLTELGRRVGRRFARHFLHELIVFVNTPYSVREYDERVFYASRQEVSRTSPVFRLVADETSCDGRSESISNVSRRSIPRIAETNAPSSSGSGVKRNRDRRRISRWNIEDEATRKKS
ncbi:unnamed protein product [Notodromas monacha]|uniref:RING-type E3 ubiquitin transferase n=1 Tax=Notodromas monacha TaxID=399045 RepID=A0A7R9BMW5_9CRUS|nr:unnamed protein product [Notodromas monacha]CAG0918435.1 unnamed protein product [Notodromas monacha]